MAFVLSTIVLALASVSPYQKGFAALAYAQPRASASRKTRATNQKSRGDQWYLFKSPDGDFTLKFPKEPKLQDVAEGPATLIRSYAATTQDGNNFSINFHDIGGDPESSDNNEWSQELEEVMAVADRNQNIKVIQTHRLARNVIEAEVLQTVPETGSTINYLRRSILRRARVYTLACGSIINYEKVERPLCEKFFNSIRFNF
jgi:hypothetical protein